MSYRHLLTIVTGAACGNPYLETRTDFVINTGDFGVIEAIANQARQRFSAEDAVAFLRREWVERGSGLREKTWVSDSERADWVHAYADQQYRVTFTEKGSSLITHLQGWDGGEDMIAMRKTDRCLAYCVEQELLQGTSLQEAA